MSERQLTEAEAARAGDVFTAHQRFVESVARQHSPHPQDVPDIVATVGLQVCRGLNGYRAEGEIRAWLRRVTVNAARMHRRAQARHQAVLARAAAIPPPEPTEDPDEAVHQAERLTALHQAVARLTDRQRAAIRDMTQPGSIIVDRKLRTTRYRAVQRLRDIMRG